MFADMGVGLDEHVFAGYKRIPQSYTGMYISWRAKGTGVYVYININNLILLTCFNNLKNYLPTLITCYKICLLYLSVYTNYIHLSNIYTY